MLLRIILQVSSSKLLETMMYLICSHFLDAVCNHMQIPSVCVPRFGRSVVQDASQKVDNIWMLSNAMVVNLRMNR
jgi:hypothetical protein